MSAPDPDSFVDPDGTDVPRGPAIHLQPRTVLLVALGGALGTGAREGLILVVPADGAFPSALLLINVVGAFVLGALLEALLRRGAESTGRRALRLLLGTGICGGFTTYSALATATAALLGDSAVATGVLYAVATLVLGAAATWAGIATGARTAAS